MAVKTKARPRASASKTAKGAGKTGKAASAPSLKKLGYAIVFVGDMKRGVKFYRDTLGIPLRFEDSEWSEFEMTGLTLALHHAEKMPKKLDQAAITELCFETEDVRGTRAQLLARGVRMSDLHSVCEYGGAVGAAASFRDPDGNHLSIFGFIPKAEWSGTSECC